MHQNPCLTLGWVGGEVLGSVVVVTVLEVVVVVVVVEVVRRPTLKVWLSVSPEPRPPNLTYCSI